VNDESHFDGLEPLPIGDVVAIFGRWLYLPDPRPLLAVLGTVAANRLPGDPVWLLLVGPPGGGKSELLQSVGRLPDVHAAATLTEPALLSGTTKRDRDAQAKGGLLRSIGDFGILLCKDFGSVLSMHRDGRAQVLAALREVYDGSWTRHLGVDGGKTLEWKGKVGLIAGCTPTIDRHHAVMGAMGERFVLMRLPKVESSEQARRALDHAGREAEMRAALMSAVESLFASELLEPRPLDHDERERLILLTDLVVRCRSAVERDSYSREIELIPDPEAPTRLVIVLERLLAGLDAIGVTRDDAWSIVTKVGLDSMPALRRLALNVLYEADEEITSSQVADATDHPKRTSERALEDLTAHGIVQRHGRGQGIAATWELSTWARTRYATALTSPETSDHPVSLLNLPLHAYDDKTGEVARNGQPPSSEEVERLAHEGRDLGL
jgi:hypothetical protein